MTYFNFRIILITKGIPGSGKTSWALEQMRRNPRQFKRFNKDSIWRRLGLTCFQVTQGFLSWNYKSWLIWMCKKCEHEEYRQIIEELLCLPHFDFAKDYLSSCLNWIEHRRHITPKQVMAIDRIRSSVYAGIDENEKWLQVTFYFPYNNINWSYIYYLIFLIKNILKTWISI